MTKQRLLLLAFFVLFVTIHVRAQSGRVSADKLPPVPTNITCSLVNGDRVSGRALSISSSAVAIETIFAGPVTLRPAAIVSCATQDGEVQAQLAIYQIPANVTVAAAAPSPAAGTPVNITPAPSATRGEAAKSAPPPATARQTQSNGHESDWKRAFAFNYSLARGNSNSSDFNITGGITRKMRDSSLRLSGLLRRGARDGNDFANLFTATVRYEHKIDGDQPLGGLSYFSEAGYEQDQLKKLDHRLVFNGGMTVPLIKDKTKEMSFDLGSGLTREMFSTGVERTLGTGLLRFTSEQTIFTRARFKQQVSVFPEFSDVSRYRMQADVSFLAPINKVFSIRLGALNRYDSRPQDNVKRNDFSLLSGLGIEF
jgi:putative salt-induced outer membrane protein YdiY